MRRRGACIRTSSACFRFCHRSDCCGSFNANEYHETVRIESGLLIRKKASVLLACAAGLIVSFGGLTIHLGSTSVWESSALVDETSFRNATEFLGTTDLYDPEAYATIQRREYNAVDSFRVFLRPPWYALASVWLKSFSTGTSLMLWRIVM